MRATVERHDLAEACKSLKAFAPRKSTLPVLRCVHIETATDAVRISATDLDNTACVTISAAVEEPGAVCVPLDLLTGAVAGIDDGELVLNCVNGEIFDLLRDDKMLASLVGFPSEEFPSFSWADSPPANRALGFDVADLLAVLQRVAPFTSTDETRPSLCGVALESRRGVGVVFTATDGHRLASEFLPIGGASVWPHVGQSENVKVFDGVGMRALAKLCGSEKRAQKRMGMSAKVLIHEVPASGQGVGRLRVDLWGLGMTVGLREYDGPYPNYTKVKPVEFAGVSVDVEASTLASAVKAVLPVADKLTKQVVFDLSNGVAQLTAGTPDVGELARSFQHLGHGVMRLAYNGRYVLDLCKAFPKRARIVITPASTESAAVVTSPDAPNFWGLLMPLRLTC